MSEVVAETLARSEPTTLNEAEDVREFSGLDTDVPF